MRGLRGSAEGGHDLVRPGAGAGCVVVAGSSLVVYPAAAIPETVAAQGAPMIIINREPTPLDGLAAVALRGEVESLLPVLIDGSAGGRIPVK